MYYQYFGLNEAPFSIAVNPRYLFMSARHRDALAHLLYGVGAGGGFILLTGEVGTGKTTINRCLLEQLPDNTDIAIILNPALNALELLASACDELGVSYDRQNTSLKELTDKLHGLLLENHSKGYNTVLLIDEAQHLDFEVLEQIRLLTNLETDSKKLLQIILIGQPELAQMLARPELRQLNQRITARYNLEPLNLEETGAYIRHRLQVAGLAPERELFPARVVRGIYRRTRGIPRLINLLCDRVLLGSYGRNQGRADMQMLRLATREVMGEQFAGETAEGRWRPALLVGLLIAALGLAGWGWQHYGSALPASVSHSGGGAELALREPLVELPQQRVAAQLQQPQVGRSVYRLEAAAPSSAVINSSTTTAAGETVTVAVAQPYSAPAFLPAPGRWQLGLRQGQQVMWSFHSVAAMPAELCSERLGSPATLVCERDFARTWAILQEFQRPVLLSLISAEGGEGSAILLGFDGNTAMLWSDTAVARVNLPELAALWTGEYAFLWSPPNGFTQPLTVWTQGPAVTAVAQLFAQLDGQQTPLTEQVFSRSLEARVRLFQQQHDLAVDGVVGVKTLLRLNERVGIDADNATVLAGLAQSSEAVIVE